MTLSSQELDIAI